MQFSDEGYIINILKHGENSLVVTLLSSLHGKIAGFIKGGYTKKNLGIYQLSNKISFNAYFRVEENLAQFRGVELLSPLAVDFMGSNRKLAVLSSFAELMNMCLPEKDHLEKLGGYIKNFMENIKNENWLAKYAFVEFYLLEYLGIGLDLEDCVVTGKKENLAFVSPKSGRAVCFEAGYPYREKLFSFPHFVVEKKDNPSDEEVLEVLKMTEFFLIKNFFQVHNLKFPNNRGNLLHILNQGKS